MRKEAAEKNNRRALTQLSWTREEESKGGGNKGKTSSRAAPLAVMGGK